MVLRVQFGYIRKALEAIQNEQTIFFRFFSKFLLQIAYKHHLVNKKKIYNYKITTLTYVAKTQHRALMG